MSYDYSPTVRRTALRVGTDGAEFFRSEKNSRLFLTVTNHGPCVAVISVESSTPETKTVMPGVTRVLKTDDDINACSVRAIPSLLGVDESDPDKTEPVAWCACDIEVQVIKI